jgi:hypothetical protein
MTEPIVTATQDTPATPPAAEPPKGEVGEAAAPQAPSIAEEMRALARSQNDAYKAKRAATEAQRKLEEVDRQNKANAERLKAADEAEAAWKDPDKAWKRLEANGLKPSEFGKRILDEGRPLTRDEIQALANDMAKKQVETILAERDAKTKEETEKRTKAEQDAQIEETWKKAFQSSLEKEGAAYPLTKAALSTKMADYVEFHAKRISAFAAKMAKDHEDRTGEKTTYTDTQILSALESFLKEQYDAIGQKQSSATDAESKPAAPSSAAGKAPSVSNAKASTLGQLPDEKLSKMTKAELEQHYRDEYKRLAAASDAKR